MNVEGIAELTRTWPDPLLPVETSWRWPVPNLSLGTRTWSPLLIVDLTSCVLGEFRASCRVGLGDRSGREVCGDAVRAALGVNTLLLAAMEGDA